MTWDEDSLKCQLPLLASTSVDMSVTVFGVDFMSSDLWSQHPCTCYFVDVLFLLQGCSVCQIQSDDVSFVV